jgi:hypothetical protein
LFEDDAQIEIFLNIMDEYTNMNIDLDGEYEKEEVDVDICQPLNHTAHGWRIEIYLPKKIFIHRGLVPFERLFDSNDVPLNPLIKPK